MNVERLAHSIRIHEGLRLKPYLCPAGKLTIGYGRNLEEHGIAVDEAETMLFNDLSAFYHAAFRVVPGFADLGDVRQNACIEMLYQIGEAGVRKFARFLAAIEAQDFERAAAEMLDSKWARSDSPARASRLAEQMRSGEFPA